MRVALRASSVPLRSDGSMAMFDAEEIVTWSSSWSFEVFVDSDGRGPAVLRDADIPVHINPKRTDRTPVGPVSGDQVLLSLLCERHEEAPFDLILESADVLTLARHDDDRLAGVPHAVFPTDVLADLRLVFDDPVLFRRHGAVLRAVAGRLAAADIVLTNLSLATLGLDTGFLSEERSLSPVDTTSGEVGLDDRVVVSAATAGVATLANLLASLESVLPPGHPVVVIHRDLPIEGGRVRDLIVGGASEEVRRRTVLAPVGVDGVAAEFVRDADVIVATSPAELMIPLIASAAQTARVICLTGELESPRLFESSVMPVPTGTPATLIPYGADAASVLEQEHVTGSSGVVLFDGDLEAAKAVAERVAFDRTDLVLLTPRDAAAGGAHPHEVGVSLLGIGGRALAAVALQAREAANLEDLILRCLDPAHTDRLTLQVIGGSPSRAIGVPGSHRQGLAPWVGTGGLLPRPYLVSGEEVIREVTTSVSVKEWAQSRRFSDRIRLVLPWKWGLLPKAMRGRW